MGGYDLYINNISTSGLALTLHLLIKIHTYKT
jgi:hypothetical protein